MTTRNESFEFRLLAVASQARELAEHLEDTAKNMRSETGPEPYREAERNLRDIEESVHVNLLYRARDVSRLVR